MKVLKFGGSSVATPARIRSVVDIIKPYLSGQVAVVFSAFGGVTDELLAISKLALDGDQQYSVKADQLEKRHLEAVRELISIQKQSSILAQVKIKMNELEDVLHGVYLVKERTPRTLDYIMSFGERLSAFIIAEAMKDQGIPAEYLDARTVIATDDHFGNARVDFTLTNQRILRHFEGHSVQEVAAITGRPLAR